MPGPTSWPEGPAGGYKRISRLNIPRDSGEMKRILFVVTKLDPPETGGERYNLEIFNYLTAKGYEIALHVEKDIPELLRRAPGAWFAYLKLFFSLPEPTLIFTSHGLQTRLFLPLLLVKLFTGHKIVSIAHLLFRYRSNLLFKSIDQRIDRLYFSTADAVIANSVFTRNQLIDMGVHPENISVIYPGVGLPVKGRDLIITDERVKLLSVGYLSERKGYHILLKALAGLKNYYLLRVAGSFDIRPDYSRELFDLKETLGLSERVEFLGHVNHGRLLEIYEESDIFILASEFEGSGIAFFEPASYQLAIVTTTGGAVPEFFKDRETALLVPPGDINALRGAIRKLIDDPGLRRRVGENASRMPILKRTWEDTARDVESVVARFVSRQE